MPKVKPSPEDSRRFVTAFARGFSVIEGSGPATDR